MLALIKTRSSQIAEALPTFLGTARPCRDGYRDLSEVLIYRIDYFL